MITKAKLRTPDNAQVILTLSSTAGELRALRAEIEALEPGIAASSDPLDWSSQRLRETSPLRVLHFQLCSVIRDAEREFWENRSPDAKAAPLAPEEPSSTSAEPLARGTAEAGGAGDIPAGAEDLFERARRLG